MSQHRSSIPILAASALGAAACLLPASLASAGEDEALFGEVPSLQLSAAASATSIPPLPSAALAETGSDRVGDEYATPRDRNLGLKAGLGFTVDPTTFLMTFQADLFLTRNFALGPLFQFGVDDHEFVFAPTLNLQVLFDLPSEGFERLKPGVQFGLGLAYMEDDRRRGDDDEVGFLLNFGFGLDYFLTDEFALGTNMLFNILPEETLGEHFFWSWQVLTFRFQF